MKENEEHLSVIKGTKGRLKKVAEANERTMRGQLEWMLKQEELRIKRGIEAFKEEGSNVPMSELW